MNSYYISRSIWVLEQLEFVHSGNVYRAADHKAAKCKSKSEYILLILKLTLSKMVKWHSHPYIHGFLCLNSLILLC